MTQTTDGVTRVEIAEVVADAFEVGIPDRDTLIRVASQNGARPEVLTTLEKLPERRFSGLRQLWEVLRKVPVGV